MITDSMNTEELDIHHVLSPEVWLCYTVYHVKYLCGLTTPNVLCTHTYVHT